LFEALLPGAVDTGLITGVDKQTLVQAFPMSWFLDAGASLQALTGAAYAKVKMLLDAKDKPDVSGLHKHLGLQHLDGGSGASIAKKWVCKKCEAGFKRDGADFKPGAKGGGGGGAAEDEAEYPPLPPPRAGPDLMAVSALGGERGR
jgi:hypothetical protein